MSLPSNDFEPEKVAKVTFTPVSKGTTQALIVTIKTVLPQFPEEEIPRFARPSPVRKAANAKPTMSGHKEKEPRPSQTRLKSVRESIAENKTEAFPCMKHAAQNIGRKASDIEHEKINLCDNCSKSMLSYIFLVQDFLDSLAKEISGEKSDRCLQCARQELRDNIAALDGTNHPEAEAIENVEKSEDKVPKDSSNQKTKKSAAKTRPRRYRQDLNKDDRLIPPELESKTRQMDFIYDTTPSAHEVSQRGRTQEAEHVNLQGTPKESVPPNSSQQSAPHMPTRYLSEMGPCAAKSPITVQSNSPSYHEKQTVTDQRRLEQLDTRSEVPHQNAFQEIQSNAGKPILATSPPFESYNTLPRLAPFESGILSHSYTPTPRERNGAGYSNRDVRSQDFATDPNPVQDSPSLFKDGVDGIVSTLSSAEREIYDSARDKAGWESLTGPQERLVPPQSGNITTEAFVTYCRNNAEAIGCLTVGTSLLLCRTSRTLCVLVADGVSTAFKGALSAVFPVVQFVRSLDSLGTTKLALLEQPELGISFNKLNIWRLVQFNKCVYLNPDTLVIRNCDELFNCDELSAVPDIGWPDCFNSGMFVYRPSIHTFWQLMEFAENQGSYDGGDQGLLNSYFTSWSTDISKKLSFTYNLMANVSYTYTPAFRQFGRDVKIVQFHGSFKPWHVKFFTSSGQISPSSPVHPTYVQFVHIWLNIFRISVLRLMSQEIKSYAASTETICAVEILRFFPLPTESEADFFLTPPSVRVKLAERKLQRSSGLSMSEARRRKSAEFPRYRDAETEITPEDIPAKAVPHEIPAGENEGSERAVVNKPAEAVVNKPAEELAVEKSEVVKAVEDEAALDPELDEVFQEKKEDKNALPGAEVGNYQGMKAWEQGRMDYEGKDGSENIIKRLEFLMSRPK